MIDFDDLFSLLDHWENFEPLFCGQLVRAYVSNPLRYLIRITLIRPYLGRIYKQIIFMGTITRC